MMTVKVGMNDIRIILTKPISHLKMKNQATEPRHTVRTSIDVCLLVIA